MAETLIFSTGSRVISGTLSSTASISQLNLDGVSGSFTGTFIGDVIGAGLISSSAQFDENDSFTMDNLIVSGALDVLGRTILHGTTDIEGDLEIREGFGLRIGNSSFFQGPDPTDILAQSSSLQELQMIGGNEGPDSSMMLATFSNTGSNGPFLIFGRSAGNGVGSFVKPFEAGSNLGGLLWSVAQGTALRLHAASITAEVDTFNPTTGFASAELIFSVAQNVSANDITQAMRIRSDLTLELTGSLAHAGPNLGFYTTTPIAQQTGVAVTDVAIHAALVALGLITA